MDVLNKLSICIKKIANEKHVSFAQIERNWDFSNGILYSWQTNKSISDKLFKLANYFNVSTDYLLGITDKRYLLSKDKIALKSTLKTAVTLNKELYKKKKNRNEHEWGEDFSRWTCITIYK